MLFVTAQFALFLALVWYLLLVLPKRASNGLLLTSSLVFYTLWIPAYLPLLLVDIGVNYALLRGMLASPVGSPRRRLFFFASVVFTLGLLIYFKYAVFLVENALPLLRATGIELPLPEILLPLGISFYTFQIISLVADLYPDDSEQTFETPGLARYALFIGFFPQLIAGPILRGSEFLPQLSEGPRQSATRARRGLWLLASGVGKKVIVADFLLAPFVEAVFNAPGVGNAATHWVAVFAFSFQIYFDFSGYTDMARGVALLLGYELPANFREPFLSRSPQEFWNRWHITLSRWLRLYLFTPVSHWLMRRGGPSWDGPAVPVALLLTMTICGIWHGAGWPFVVWGAMQGLLLVCWVLPRLPDATPLLLRHVPRILVFYTLFSLTLVVFRAPDLVSAGAFYQGLFAKSSVGGWPVLESAVVVLCAGLHLAERWARPRAEVLQAFFATRSWGLYAEAVTAGMLLGAATLVAGAGGEFIYFQF